MAFHPGYLEEKNGGLVCSELFGEGSNEKFGFKLSREDKNIFNWVDERLSINFRAKHGYLIALHEVSTYEQAIQFSLKNRIHLFEDGGLYFKGKGVAELFIRCIGLPPREEIQSQNDLFRIRLKSGIEASVGYGSFLFYRLVGAPATEINPSLPDPESLSSIVISGIERNDVPGSAELALFHLRECFSSSKFNFWRLPDLALAPRLEEGQDVPDVPGLKEDLPNSSSPEAIAFFNRAKESDPISGFLYFYRVLEACFDTVLNIEIEKWRCNDSIDSKELLSKIRRLQHEREDKWALRRVLGQVLEQPTIDSAKENGIVDNATADDLNGKIYSRRNSIAHGRKGQHRQILVPFGFTSGGDGQHDRLWYELMESLARKALDKWILV